MQLSLTWLLLVRERREELDARERTLRARALEVEGMVESLGKREAMLFEMEGQQLNELSTDKVRQEG